MKFLGRIIDFIFSVRSSYLAFVLSCVFGILGYTKIAFGFLLVSGLINILVPYEKLDKLYDYVDDYSSHD